MRILPWFLTITICLAVTGALAAIKYIQIAEAMAMAESFPPPFSVITTAATEQVEWTPVRRLTGSVRAPNYIDVAAEAPGRIVSLPAASGQIIEQGAIVVQLFDEDLKAQRSALAADLRLVEIQLERVQKLKQSSLASQDQLDTLLARGESLRAQMAATEAQLSRLTIRAPFTGRLGIYTQSVGDLMQAGDILTTLTGVGSTRWIDFKIPQGVARVAPGDTVRLLSLDKEFIGDAVITAVSGALNAGLRALDVRAEIDDPNLRHGELVLVEVRTRDARLVYTLPGKAVRWDVEGPHVFVMSGTDASPPASLQADLRRIQVLGEVDGRVMAVGDIRAGEEIAVQGAFKLADGGLAAAAPTQDAVIE